MLKKLLKHLKENSLIYFLITTGSTLWSLTMIKSGIVYDYGMGFWGPNGHDGIWHIAVINSLAKGSFEMPIFAGENLKNYHIGFDLLIAVLHRISFIPVINLYFQIVPPLLALLVGVFVYRFIFIWRRSKIQALFSTFFVYFSGSFGWIITLIRGDGFGGESLFWAQQSLSTLINPPFALSLVVIFAGLYILARNDNARHIPDYDRNTSGVNAVLSRYGGIKNMLLALLFAALIQIKVYAGALMLISLVTAGVWNYIKEKDTRLIKLSIIVAVLSFVFIFPTYDLRSGGLVFQPFWFLDSMVATPDRLYWPKMASALINYKLAGNILKGSLAYASTFIIFLIGNAGIRIIALPWIAGKLKHFKKLDTFDAIVLTIIFCGILIPMLFIQKGNSWNSIQFFYYSLVFLSALSGISIGEYFEKLKKPKGNVITVFFIFILTIPTVVATLRHYLPSRPPAKISKEELTALEFLKTQPEGVVLTLPFDKNLADKEIFNPPRPLYLYESTAYVSALTIKQVYLEDEVNLEITGYNWRERKNNLMKNIRDMEYLRSVGIRYVYITPKDGSESAGEMGALDIYNKDGFQIFKI